MSLRFLLNGYTGRCTLNGLNTLMTSWGLSVSTNVIKSGASVPLWKGTQQTGKFTRFAGHAVRDFPAYQVSVSVEPEKVLFNNVMERFNGRGFRDEFDVQFEDNATHIEYSFKQSYLTSFGFAVSNGAVCSLSFSFICFNEKFDMVLDGDYNLKANKINGKSNPNVKNLVGDVLMPYWAFGIISTHGVDENDDLNSNENDDLNSNENGDSNSNENYPYRTLQEFSFDYSQSVEPKFGCVGSSSGNAVEPLAAIFGQPSLTYSLTYVIENDFDVDDYKNDSNLIAVGGDTNNLDIRYNGNSVLKFFNCFPDSYTPSLGQANGVSTFGVAGTVYGGVEFTKIPEDSNN